MTDTHSRRGRLWLKLLAWFAGGLLALFVVGALVLYFLVPREKIIAQVVPRVEAALQRPVSLADAGISLWPPFGVYLAGLRVEDPKASDDMLRIESLRAQLAWRPLLSGELRFSSVSVSGLAFHYEQFDDSTSSLTDLLAGPGGMIPVLVEHLDFVDLRLTMADRRDTSAWILPELSLRLDLNAVTLDFEGKLNIPRVESRRGDSVVVYDGPLELAARGSARRNPQGLTVHELTGSLRDVPLSGRLALERPPSGAVVDAELLIGPTEWPTLLGFLPGPRKAAFAAFDLGGRLELTLQASGPIDLISKGGARAVLAWSDGRIADSTGEWLSFALLRIPVDHQGFHVDAEQVVTRFGPVRFAAVGSWPPEDRLEVSVAGNSRLASFLTGDTSGVAGSVEWSASAYGPMADPMAWQLGARAQLSAVQFQEPSRDPFTVDSGEINYDGASLRLERVRARYGRSDVQLDGEIDGLSWREYMKQKTLSPRAAFRVHSRRLDLDALFPHLAGDSAAPADTSSRPPLPPGRAHLLVDADTLWLGGAVWRRVHAEFTLEGERCEIDTLHGLVYGGRLGLAGHIDSLSLPKPSYELHLEADSLEVGDLLGRFGAAGRHLRGRSQLSAHINGSGQTASDVIAALTVDGTVKLFDARLQELNVAGKIQELLGLKLQDPLPLKSVVNSFRVEHGRTRVDDFKFSTPQGAWILGGSAGLDGSLDYALAGRMPPELAAKVSLPDSWTQALPAEWRGRVDPLDLLKGDDGAIDLFFKIGGTFRQPDVAVDWDRLQPLFKQRFESRMKEELSDEAEKKLKEGLKGLFDKLKR